MRALGWFWATLLAVLAAGAGALQWLGPLPRPAEGASHAQARPTEGGPTAESRSVERTSAPAEAGSPLAPAAPAPQPERIAAPDPALQEDLRPGQESPLPRISSDRRWPMRVYARPFDTRDTRPRVALLLAGVGLSDAESRAAIEGLPGGVTLALSAYARHPAPLLELARARGHEFLASLPMESEGYPMNDSGQRALLTGASPEANDRNLTWALTRFSGYVGATAAGDNGLRGERYAAFGDGLSRILGELHVRGLLYVDPRPGAEVPPGPASRAADLIVDDPPSRAQIEAKLAQLERIARDRGSALGVAGPLRPVTVERLVAWARGLDEKGLALAPVSAIVSQPAPLPRPMPAAPAAAPAAGAQRGH